MRLALVEVAEERVEPLVVGQARLIAEAQAPFAEHARGVPGLLQQLGDRNVLRLQRMTIRAGAVPDHVLAHCRMALVQALHERGA